MRHKRLSEYRLLIGEISESIRAGKPLEQAASGELVKFRGMEPEIKTEGLQKKDRVLLEEFFSSLGMGDTLSEIKRCEAYAEFVKKQEAEAEAQVKAKAVLYSKLGFFAGLFIAVMVV